MDTGKIDMSFKSNGTTYIVENISLQKKGDSYLTHWKINKRAPFQFTNLGPNSFKEKSQNSKSSTTKHNKQQNQQQTLTTSMQQHSTQFTTQQNQPDHSTHFTPQNTNSERIAIKYGRKRSIHDLMNDTPTTELHDIPTNFQWISTTKQETLGRDYVSTLTTEQQMYLSMGRSRSVPAAHFFTTDYKMQPQQKRSSPSRQRTPSPNQRTYQDRITSLKYLEQRRSSIDDLSDSFRQRVELDNDIGQARRQKRRLEDKRFSEPYIGTVATAPRVQVNSIWLRNDGDSQMVNKLTEYKFPLVEETSNKSDESSKPSSKTSSINKLSIEAVLN